MRYQYLLKGMDKGSYTEYFTGKMRKKIIEALASRPPLSPSLYLFLLTLTTHSTLRLRFEFLFPNSKQLSHPHTKGYEKFQRTVIFWGANVELDQHTLHIIPFTTKSSNF